MQTVRSKYPYGGIFFSSSLSEIVWLAKNWKWKLDPTAPLYTARLSRQDLENLIEGPGFYAGIENYEELVFYSPDAIKTIARSFQLKLVPVSSETKLQMELYLKKATSAPMPWVE